MIQILNGDLPALKTLKDRREPASAVSLRSYMGWGGLWGLRDPPETQKSQKETPPESSGITTTLKPDSNPPKNFGDQPLYA